jgi:hypothetical protein
MSTPAKQDKRRRTDAQKRQTKQRLLDDADRRRRLAEWRASEAAARAAGVPINAQLTVLSKTEDIAKVTASLWRRLRRLMKRNGLPFIAARAPEYAAGRKHHVHIIAHIPEHLYGDVANIVSDVTETVMAPWFDTNGRRLGRTGPYGVVTMAHNGDWMFQRHVDGIGGSPERLVRYGATGQGKHRSIGRHQRSQHLIEIARKVAA